MIIEESDFKMEGADDYNTFDLYLLYVVNAKDPEKRREEMKLRGYNMSMELCIKTIVNYRISKKLDITTLKVFLDTYKDEVKKLKALIET
jgi:hypothetical protein